MAPPSEDRSRRTRRTVVKLVTLIPVMFAFAIVVLPPVYNIACSALGLNGRGALSQGDGAPAAVDTSRSIQVEFSASVNQGTPFRFTAPAEAKKQIHPGELVHATYRAKNLSDEPVKIQAVHSIIPGLASKHIELMQCFCYNKQTFKPGEEREMPVAFKVSPELPAKEQTITFSYTFFRLDEKAPG
jgi:cytochrome c oxidase assembly protein subunit 11